MVIKGNLPPPELMTSAEAADYLGRPISWIYTNKHMLPRFRVGHELRFRRSELDAWLEAHREGDPMSPPNVEIHVPRVGAQAPIPTSGNPRKERS